jgi:stage IV sporulation protein FB
MFSGGYYTIGRFKGAPIRIHWTAPLGALFLGRFQFVPGFWIGFFLLVLIHELGHAIVIRYCQERVTGIELHALGGQCRWEGSRLSQLKVSMIAWGGVWAQAVLFVAVQLVLLFVEIPPDPYVHQFVHALTTANLWMMGFNLLPMRPLDGAEAWPLFRILWERWKMRRQIRSSAKPIARPAPKKPVDPKYSDRVRDPEQSEELFNRLMSNNPLEEEEEER